MLKVLVCTLSEVGARAQRVYRKYFWITWLLEDLDDNELYGAFYVFFNVCPR